MHGYVVDIYLNSLMLKITRFTDYAFLVLCCFVTSKNNRLSTIDIAKLVKLQPPTVSKILKLLVKSGLLISYRGASGGYSISKDPKTITVSQVIACLEGPVTITSCNKTSTNTSTNTSTCEHVYNCQLMNPWQKINNAINGILDKITIFDMAYNKIEF